MLGEADKTQMDALAVEPAGSRDDGPCACCGHNSRCVWGCVRAPDGALASYFVHWTLGRVADHGANVDLIIGRWGDEASASDRVLVALTYRLSESGPAFMVIDADGRTASSSELVGRALARAEVVGQPIAEQAFAIIDAVLAQDPRVAELLGAGERPQMKMLSRGQSGRRNV
jgi:hypothetical protein